MKFEFDRIATSTNEELWKNATAIANETMVKTYRENWLKKAISCIDLTTLEGSDTENKIVQLCRKASGFYDEQHEIPNVAAVCVYPVFIELARKTLEGTGVKVASVAGAFPAGQSPLPVKVAEVAYARKQGADEIDIVISRGKIIEGKYDEVFQELQALREAAGEAHLKVILETGELFEPIHICRASELAIKAGADFIKTSTGKIPLGATLEALLVMMQVIQEYHSLSGRKIGIKPSGGIGEPDDAIRCLALAFGVLGPDWTEPDLFRIGASRLADKVAADLISAGK